MSTNIIEQLREASQEMSIDGYHAWSRLCLDVADLLHTYLHTSEVGASETGQAVLRSDRTETDGAGSGANIDQEHCPTCRSRLSVSYHWEAIVEKQVEQKRCANCGWLGPRRLAEAEIHTDVERVTGKTTQARA